jgi:diguanylate cyclase (GGDEF)-like protein
MPEEPQKQRILIVDDAINNIKVLGSTLQQPDYKIFFALNAQEGLKSAIANQPDLILLDIMMPEMDGYEICRRLKTDERTKDIPVIFITAKNDEEDEVKGFEMGGVDYITKPFRPVIAKTRIKTHLELKKRTSELQSAYEKIKTFSITDSLTGCFNRHYMDDHLTQEISRAKRYSRKLSVIMCDVDHFKLVNDNWGHQAGDRVLIEVSAVLCGGVRQDADWVARYGGEEFLVVLPETSSAKAASLAERMRTDLESMNICLDNQTIKVTASFGLTSLKSDDNKEADTLLGRADTLLYQAKQSGRNRVITG